MKAQFIACIILALTTISPYAQTQVKLSETAQVIENPVYQLFPTQNMWTFIKLNTRNGKMWQVQYVVSGDNRFETFLSLRPLVSEEEEVNGRFTLYPTQNMYNFLLLDQINGYVYQVQWAIKKEQRFVILIY